MIVWLSTAGAPGSGTGGPDPADIVVRAPQPGKGPLWADRRLAEVRALLAQHPGAVVVCADPDATPFAWRVAEDHPDTAVLADPAVAERVLNELDDRDIPPDAAAVRALLDPQRPVLPPLPPYLRERADRPPLVVSLVNNTVVVDSRVQKVARSLADLGYDSVLIGRAPRAEPDGDWFLLGRALVLRVPVRTTRLDRQRRNPPTSRVDRWLGAPDPHATGRWARRLNAWRGERRESARSAFTAGADGAAAHQGLIDDITAGRLSPEAAYPAISDWADAFTPTILELRPDVIHIHDPVLLAAALRSQRRLARAGHAVRLVYDAHEYTPGVARPHVLQVPALTALERAHLGEMDAVITVSDDIAALLRTEHGLTGTPTVVTNAPVVGHAAGGSGDVRTDVGVAADTPLLVYAGSIAETRGLDLALRALRHVPDAHLALLSRDTPSTRDTLRQARRLGVRDRVHRLDYVPADDVPGYLSTADAGLMPFRPHRNSDLGVPTKFREYVAAGIPVVGTDVGAPGAAVRASGVGEVAPPDDPKAYAGAIRRVLTDPERYRAAITPELVRRHSWQEQETRLADVYATVVGRPMSPPAAPAGVLIGALNSAGQGDGWARSLRSTGHDARSLELRTAENPFGFPGDLILPRRATGPLDRRVQLLLREVAAAGAVVLESGRAIAAPEPGSVSGRRTGLREARALQDAGRPVALLFHGSDLRRPDVHRRTHPWSPFADPRFADVTAELTKRTRLVHAGLASWDGPVLVSTPDLLRQHPAAQWVPVVVDVDEFAAPDRIPPTGPPVVLHVPSKSMLKGSHHIDPVLRALADEGLIRYLRAESVPHTRIPDLLRGADIVVDQVGMGILGVGAVEAMAAGAVVVTDPGPEALTAYGEEVPVVVVDPGTLAERLRALAADPGRRAALSAAGPPFARRHHDGTRSAAALAAALDLAAGSAGA